MGRKILIAPSILSADFARLEAEIKKVEDSGADMFHIDVMDGHFVPNITIGPVVVEAVKRYSSLPLDVHLMIEEPHRFIKAFVDSGSDIITVHAEAYGKEIQTTNPLGSVPESKIQKGKSVTIDKIDDARVKEVLGQIKSLGKKAGVSLNPDSPFCLQGILKDVDMILIMSVHPGFGGQGFIDSVLPKIKEARKVYQGDIEVDGGINEGNVKSVIDAGANVIVAGSYFFTSENAKQAVKRLRGSKC